MSIEKANAFKKTLAELREAIRELEAVVAQAEPTDLAHANLSRFIVEVGDFAEQLRRVNQAIAYANEMRRRATEQGVPRDFIPS